MRSISSFTPRALGGLFLALLTSQAVWATDIRVVTSGAFTEAYKKLVPIYEEATGKKIYSERVGTVVERGDAEIGFQQVSELIYFKNLDFIGTLPDAVQQTIFFSVGLVQGAQEPQAARHLLTFLTSPAVADIVRATGLDPVNHRTQTTAK